MYIKVRVTAGAKKEEVNRLKSDQFSIKVKEPAENNLANRRLAEILAEAFSCPVSRVKLISGHHHPHKIFDIKLKA